MRLQDPMTEVINKALDLANENFTHNSISPTPPGFNMCIEDFMSLGIGRDVFGSIYFVFSTAIPCKFKYIYKYLLLFCDITRTSS